MVENLDHVGLNVNRTRTAQEGCVGCRFKLEPVSVEMGSIHTRIHTHTHTVGGRGWVYLFYIVRFRLSIR